MKKDRQSEGRFALEGLEPRLLLSADPIGELVASLDAESEEPMSAIMVEADENTFIAQEENPGETDLYNGVADEALPCVTDSDSGSPEMEDASDPESYTLTSCIDTSANHNFDNQIAPSEVDFSSIMTEQMVTTLHAGNGPPDSGVDDLQSVTNLHESYSDISTTHLNDAVVQDILNQAAANWSEFITSAELSERLSNISITFADLPDGILGEALGMQITLDTNAAGRNWFVDTTPDEHSEFTRRGDGSFYAISGEASEGVDLLTVVMHEMGHVLGLADQHSTEPEIMDASIQSGLRILPTGISLSENTPLSDVAQYVVVSDEVTDALADGLDAFDDLITNFLNGEDLLGERVPFLLQAGTDDDDNPVFTSPTVSDLLTVPVDANGDGSIGEGNLGFPVWDDDEFVLQDMDGLNGTADDEVDAVEFLRGFLINPLLDYLYDSATTTEGIVEELEGDGIFDNAYDDTLDQLYPSSYQIDFNIVNSGTADTTQDPDAEVTFTLSFTLSVSQMMPIDLGLSADALKILPFQIGTDEAPKAPEVEVVSTLSFAFEFGVLTGGQDPGDIDVNDFFIRTAEPLTISVVSNVPDIPDFRLNVGFLGAEVVDGSLDLQADVITVLLDPDDPAVLGFTDDQRGVEETSGSVTADDALTVPEDHSAGFFLRIGNLGITTPVTVVDDNPAGIDTTTEVINDINDALAAADLDDLVSASLVGGKVKLALVSTSSTPLGFADESLSLTGVIDATPDGDGSNIYEYLSDEVFLLSVGGQMPEIVRVNFPDPSDENIGFDDGQAASVPYLIAPSQPTVYDITADADFTVNVWQNNGSYNSYAFTVTDTDTDGNGNATALATDIDAKLTGSAIDTLVQFTASGGYVRIGPIDSSVSAIQVLASGTATSEIGFSASAIVGLRLLGADTATSDLSEAAHFKLILNDAGTTTTYFIEVPDNDRGTLGALATDINAAIDSAIGSNRISAYASASSGKILLTGVDTDVRSFSVRTINLTIDDLVADVNRSLETAGLSGQVTASAIGGDIRLATTGGESIEISKTLTFDAGVTNSEFSLPITDLFAPSEGEDSKVEFELPVKVLPGLYDEINDVADWDPVDVVIIGYFDPFNSASAVYDSIVNRFDLLFNYEPDPGLPGQDTAPVAIPTITPPDNDIILVNFGELLNFNIMTAESMIGLLGGLGSALRQLSGTPVFTGYEIPFADATLSDLLNFADSDKEVYSGLIDMLLYDTGGDGVDPAPTIVNDDDGLLKWVKIDNSTAYLLPAFTTAQTLATALSDLLYVPLSGAGGVNATYNITSNELTYQLDLRASDRTATDTTVSFENDVPLDPFNKLNIDYSVPEIETSVELRGRTGLDLTFGVDLSPPGLVIYPSTLLTDLNGGEGIDVSDVHALTGATGVRSVYGISRDSEFLLQLDFGVKHEITIPASGSYNNDTKWGLVQDIQDAIDAVLDGTPDAGKILVGVSVSNPDRLGIQHTVGGGSVQIYVDNSDPWVAELGFPNNTSGGVPNTFHTLIARKGAPLLIGRLSGILDATFEIDIVTDRDGNPVIADPIEVEIPVSATSTNRSAADLVADVNNALISALAGTGYEGFVKAAFDNSQVSGTRLVLVAGDEIEATDDTQIEFTVKATNTKANTELGLPNVATAANQYDFVIYDHTGLAHPITLDPSVLPANPNVENLIDLINASFPDPDGAGPLLPIVEASLNGLHTGFRLITNLAGPEQFRVETINDSGALIGLGLFLTGDDALPDTFGTGDPDLIEGGGIGLASLDGRFFVRDAQLRIDGLQVKTPDVGIPGDGLYGIVGVDTITTGDLNANVTVPLIDPDNSDLKDQITLEELMLEKEDALGPVSVTPVIELDYDGQIAVFPLGEFSVGGLLVTATPGDSAVIVGIIDDTGGGDTTGTLLLANVNGDFENDEAIGQTSEGVFVAVAYANGTTASAADFGHFTMEVQVQPGPGEAEPGFDDDLAFDSDFAALNDAPYTLPFDLTGFGNGGPPSTSVLDLDTYLGELSPLDKLSYTHFQTMLGDLLDVLQLIEDNFGELTVLLPAINRSISDLLGLVEPFARGVENADARFDAAILAIDPLEVEDLPALTLQQMGSALRGAFGLPEGIDPTDGDAVDWISLDYDTGDDELLFSMQLHEEVSTKLGLDIDPGGGGAHLTSAGVLEVTGNLDVRLDVAIDLDNPEDAYLLSTSNLNGSLHVQGEGQLYSNGDPGLGMVFRTTAGPLAVFVQDGDALIDFAFALPGLNFVTEVDTTRRLLSDVEYSDFLPKDISKNTIEIVLPMFYGGEGPNDYIGEYEAIGDVGTVSVILPPDLAIITAGITGGDIPYDPFDNILLAIDTLDLYLETLSDQVSSDVLGLNLPFIGDQMADVLFIEDFRSVLVRTLKKEIENAIDPTPELVMTILNDLFNSGGVLDSYVVDNSVDDSDKNLIGNYDTRYRQWNFTIAHTDTIIIDNFDIGIENLGFDIDVPVTVTFDWSIVIGLGVSYGEGAYIDVSDSGELDLDLTIEMPSNMTTTPYQGEFGFMRLEVTDTSPASGAKLYFDINVMNGSTPAALRLGFADLGSMDPDAILNGEALGSDPIATFHFQTDAAPGLPDLQADFVLDWEMPTDTDVDSLNGDAVTDYITLIELNDISLDAYSAVKKLLGPAFDEIAKFIDPFMPVIDVLTAPIPILSDLAGEPFTILDLAAIFGDVDPRFIDAIADILDIIAAVANIAENGLPLPLGSLTLWDTDGGITTFDPTNPAARTSDIFVTIPMAGLTHDAGAYTTAQNNDPSGFIPKVRDGLLAEGLDMPIITQAQQGIMLLLGNPVATLVSYELPPLGVSFEYLQTFPVWGPLAVSIEINFGFTVDLHAVGFDTYGYKRFADSGFRNPGLIFDGFFFNDAETDGGPDAPEVIFEFGLVGAAELNIGIARAGVGGGIQATIIFDWHDSVSDGHVHISELVGNVIAEGGNPLAVFDVSGELTFQLFAFLEIELLGIDMTFPITPETTLFSFNETFDRAPLLANKVGSTLYLNMGPNSVDRLNGDTSDGNETISLRYVGNDVKVWSDPLGVGEGDAQTFSGISHIVGIGGEGNDTITLWDFDGSGITADFDGGVGDDNIQYMNTSASNSWAGALIVGGLGNDTLTGGDANDIIYGGEGNDIIKGSGGYDILFGDQGRVADSLNPSFISSRITDSDGDDDIDGGAGDDVIIGAGGIDKLKGGADNDLIIGDGGRFEYTKVDQHVNVGALRPATYIPADAATYKDPSIISDEIDALQDFVLERIRATELGLGGNDVIEGGSGDDLILGGSGDDDIKGDADKDFIIAGKGFDLVHGGTGDDVIFGGDQADTLYGDADDDVMAGNSGNDLMHGDGGDDVMKGDTGADIMYGDADDDQVFGRTEPDVLFGGIGNDLVVGGTGSDIMFGDDGLVAKLDPAETDGSGDTRIIGIGNVALLDDTFRDGDIRTVDIIITDVVAGDGNDMMSGDAGDDIMLGGGGNDLMGGDVDPRLPTAGTDTAISEDVMIGDGGLITFNERRYRTIETVRGAETDDSITTGNPFNDVIFGDNGQDYIFGGRGDDFLFGGHGKNVVDQGLESAYADTFRGPTDLAANDNDIIVGDNGEMLFADDPVAEANLDPFGYLTLVRTTDEADITGGHEYVEGELGNDVIFGGVNGSVDVLFGSDGDDIILGDNGELDFALGSDTDLNTLDLIRSYRDGLGGTDTISGNAGDDVLIGGTAADTMFGDDAAASAGASDGEDIMLGDNGDIFLINDPTYDFYSVDPLLNDITLFGRLYIQVAASAYPTTVDLITTTDAVDVLHPTLALAEAVGGGDTMSGNAKADIMLGGVNNGSPDMMYGDQLTTTPTSVGNDADDIMLGDNGLLDFTYDPIDYGDIDPPISSDSNRLTLDLIRSKEDALGGGDTISGNKGLDVAIGGTGGDTIFGDNVDATAAAADLGDLLIGDNADTFLVAVNGASGGDLKVVLDAAVHTIVTTDELYDPDVADLNTGGIDTISGNAGGDIIAGGVEGDTLYGDALVTVPSLDGDDIILGDNGAFEWLSSGRLDEVLGIDIAANNPDLYDWFNVGGGGYENDPDLTTLDLVTTEQPTKGGRDTIYGDEADDMVFGGTDLDYIHGDDGNGVAETSELNRDMLFGDHGRLYPQFSTLREEGQPWQDALNSRNFFAIHTGQADGGQGDRMWGEEGDDLMLGQQGDDRMWGGTEDDDMIGGHNVSGGYDEEIASPAIDATLNIPTFFVNDIMDGGADDDAMAGDNAIIWRRGDDLSPRFRALTEDAIYTTGIDGDNSIIANINHFGDPTLGESDPFDAVGRDIEIVDHSFDVETNDSHLYGADVMAGGSETDVMFGELGDDLMQGDGYINDTDDADPATVTHEIDLVDSGFAAPDPDTSETLYFNVPEAVADADDYMEGNGGNDLMYGGLGQDDMIGGSSGLFGLDTSEERPDGADTIFGGAGVDISRNDIGDATEDGDNLITTIAGGHVRDADFIMGDNANVYRIVEGGASGTDPDDGLDNYRVFNYDNYTPDVDPNTYDRIIPRAMEQLDYTLGGADFTQGEYDVLLGAADPDGLLGPLPLDNGTSDLIHGESGDDYIFGMTGSDVIFGEGQDDDIVGGYGNDWISGGTGTDGILGDDGLVLTSRNSTLGEPMYGIAPLLASDASTRYSNGDALDELIYTPGNIQIAIINETGQLKKTIELTPFSFDAGWFADDDEFPDDSTNKPFADDILFGGLGSDFLHGGSGDDAISGAEALEHAFVPIDFDQEGNPHDILDLGYDVLNLGYDTVLMQPEIINPGDVLGLDFNPGNVLRFNPVDVDGQHLNNRYRAGEFFLYDEYDPRREILLNSDGELWKPGDPSDSYAFLLNFDETEGVVRPAGDIEDAHGQGATDYPQVWDDGKDAIFGDLGNDWLVGGTGRDNIYGGWGNDLLNADDKHDINDDSTKENTVSDTHPYYEDRAYGGAGRDILIGNTGGDRLIDWVGEYNSYLVPYAPFGQASVSRTLQPFLPEFLYALSAGDGADPTRFADAVQGPEPTPKKNNPIPSRFGEPHGELGLVLQKDFAWQQQTGAPADPQAGNIPGGHRDVLRTAGFNDGEPSGFFTASGIWTVEKGAYQVAPEVKGGDALSVFFVDEYVPSYFEIMGTLNPQKPTGGYKSNAYLIFDYHSEVDFKFAGINVSTNKLEIGHRTEAGWQVDVQGVYNKSLKSNTNYNVFLAVNGTVVTLVVDGKVSLNHTFDARVDDDGNYIGFNQGMVGLGANNSIASLDNVIVQRLAPEITFTETTDFTSNPSNLLLNFDTSGWSLNGGIYTGTGTDDSVTSLIRHGVAPAAVVKLLSTFSTSGEGGFVFDYYAPDDFKFVSLSADLNELIIGHRTSHGWFVDSTFETVVEDGDERNIEVTLKGSTISVILDDQLVLGYAFNALITDGSQGLLAASGTTGFNTVSFQTDDLAYSIDPVSNLEVETESLSSILIVPTIDSPSDSNSDSEEFSTLSSPEILLFPETNLGDSSTDLQYLY